MASVIDTVRARQVPAVICESTVSGVAMRQVAAANGARLAGVLYVDSLSTAHGPVRTCLALMRRNVDTIVRALAGGTR